MTIDVMRPISMASEIRRHRNRTFLLIVLLLSTALMLLNEPRAVAQLEHFLYGTESESGSMNAARRRKQLRAIVDVDPPTFEWKGKTYRFKQAWIETTKHLKNTYLCFSLAVPDANSLSLGFNCDEYNQQSFGEEWSGLTAHHIYFLSIGRNLGETKREDEMCDENWPSVFHVTLLATPVGSTPGEFNRFQFRCKKLDKTK